MKPVHWTYAEVDAASDLEQGDLIEPTEPLRQIFGEVHPHFCDPKYLGFAVITQSCDMVMRPECKAQHIGLVVIRELAAILPGLLEGLCGSNFENVFKAEMKHEAKKMLQRILNQNEQAMGL